jgi:transketolase
VEAGISMGWEQFTGDGGEIISLEHYGASAPAGTLFKEFGFSVENVFEKARKLLAK